MPTANVGTCSAAPDHQLVDAEHLSPAPNQLSVYAKPGSPLQVGPLKYLRLISVTGRRSACHSAESLFVNEYITLMNITAWGPQVR